MKSLDVFLVVKDYPDIFTEVERVFSSLESAVDYINDSYPYFVYYSDKDFYAMPDLSDEDLETEERYYILERPLYD